MKVRFINLFILFLCLWLAMTCCKKVPPAGVKKPEIIWFKTYGGVNNDWCKAAQQTSDGGYIIAGYSDSFPVDNGDYCLIKTDKNGDTLWTKRYLNKYWEVGTSAQQTSDGGYIIAGEMTYYDLIGGHSSTYLVKTDSLGNILWTRKYEGRALDQRGSVLQTKDGGYVVLGTNLIKADATGDEKWEKSYGGYSIQMTSDGGYIIVGRTAISISGRPLCPDVYIAKINEFGEPLWSRAYGGRDIEKGYSVRQIKDGGYIIVGMTSSFGAGMLDVYLIKTNAKGDTVWTKTYGGEKDDVGNSVIQTSDGGYIITGRTGSFDAKAWDIYLIKTDENGDTLWTFVHGGKSIDEGRSILETSDGEYVIAGITSSFGAGGYDTFLMKIKQ
jgi:hypothetical protein